MISHSAGRSDASWHGSANLHYLRFGRTFVLIAAHGRRRCFEACSTKGALIVVGSVNLGGSLELLPNAVAIAELAIDKQASTLLMPISARKQLNDLPDELWTKISIEFYGEAKDAFLKALVE